MRLVRGLLALVVAAVLLTGVLAVAWLTADFGALGKPLAGWLSGELGRTLTIDGPVSIRGGRTLRVSAEGIRLANPPWGSRPDMLAVGRLIIEVDALSLLSRPVVVQRVEADGVDLLLERRADGSSNWQFDLAEDDGSPAWPERLPVVVERVSVPGARLGFIGPRLDRPLDLRLDNLEQQRGADGMLALAGRGTANGEDFVLDARAGPFAALVAGREFTAVVDGRIGELAIDLDLEVDDIARPVATRLTFEVRGPDADYLSSRFGVRRLGSGPLVVDAVIRPAGDGIEGEFSGEVGQFAFKASGALANPQELGRLRGEVEVSGPDLSFAGGLVGINHLPVETFRLAATAERSGEVVRIDDATLTLPDGRAQLAGTINRFTALAGNDLRFEWTGAEIGRFRDLLGLPPEVTGAFALAGELKATGAQELLDARLTTTLGTLTAKGPLGPGPEYLGTQLALDASGPSLSRLGALAGVAGLPRGKFTATGNLEWTATGAVVRTGVINAGGVRLGLDGRIARDPLAPGTDINWQARGRDLRVLAQPLGVAGLPAAAFDLRGRLRREAGASRLDGVRGTIAGADLRLSGRIADTPRRGTSLELAVAGPRLEAFAALVPDYPVPPGPFRIAGGINLAQSRLVLRNLQVEAAGASGAVDADIELPLGAVRGTFTVAASGPDVTRFLPDRRPGAQPALPFKLRARGQARDGAWRLDDAELDTTAARINASGTVDWAPDFSATALKLVVTAPDLATAGRLFGTTLPAQPFELTAEFTGTPTAFKARQARGRIGTSDFDGRLSLTVAKRPVVDIDFRSDLLDLTPFVAASADTAAAPAQAAQSPAPRTRRRDAPRLIPATPIPLGWLNVVDGSLAVRATRALAPGVALDELDLVARLDRGTLTVESLELKAPPDGRLRITGELVPQGSGVAARLAATGIRVAITRPDDTAAQRRARPRADIQLELSAAGSTWRDLAQSLEGGLQLTSGPGVVPAASLNFLLGGLWREAVATVMPGMQVRDSVDARCIAAFLVATGGVLESAPAVVMQTDRVSIIARGAVDLGGEQVDLYLRTAPRRGRVDVTLAEIVNPYVKVTGPLASPGLTVDPRGVLFSGGAAVATAGLSILARGVWDRMFRADDPCAAAAAEAARLAEGSPPPGRRGLPRLRRGR